MVPRKFKRFKTNAKLDQLYHDILFKYILLINLIINNYKSILLKV